MLIRLLTMDHDAASLIILEQSGARARVSIHFDVLEETPRSFHRSCMYMLEKVEGQ
jgi:hypothetical protein